MNWRQNKDCAAVSRAFAQIILTTWRTTQPETCTQFGEVECNVHAQGTAEVSDADRCSVQGHARPHQAWQLDLWSIVGRGPTLVTSQPAGGPGFRMQRCPTIARHGSWLVPGGDRVAGGTPAHRCWSSAADRKCI